MDIEAHGISGTVGNQGRDGRGFEDGGAVT